MLIRHRQLIIFLLFLLFRAKKRKKKLDKVFEKFIENGYKLNNNKEDAKIQRMRSNVPLKLP